jgi:DNA-binding GntR family transcriptional regulator
MNTSTSDSVLSGKMEELSQFLGRRVPISDQIAEAIRSMIIAGQLNPGERIVESRVAKQLGVGQPTVREALVALEHQGLVVRKANQGCVVTKLTRGEISQMLRVRGELETLAVELAVEHASDAEIEELIGVARALKVAARKRNISSFLQTDFREQLSAAMISQVTVPLLAFLFIRNARNHHIDMEASGEAHIEMAEAIRRRDKDIACQVPWQKFQMFTDQHLDLYEQ